MLLYRTCSPADETSQMLWTKRQEISSTSFGAGQTTLSLVRRNDLASIERYVRDCRVQLVSILKFGVLDYFDSGGYRTSERSADR